MNACRRAGSAVLGLLCAVPVALAQKTPDLRLNEGEPGLNTAYEPEVASNGSTIYAVWQDTSAAGGGNFRPRDVHFDRSQDGGATWLSPEVRLDTRLPAGRNFASGLSMETTGSSVYVAFADNPYGWGLGYNEGIYLNRSLDEGATWLPTEVRVDHIPDIPPCLPQWPLGGYSPDVAASGSNVYVAWVDNRIQGITCSNTANIFFNRSLDGGLTWVPFDLRLDFTIPAFSASYGPPQLAASGSAVYAVWPDSRNGQGYDVYSNRSLDSGTTWLSTSVRLDIGPGNSEFLRIAAEGSTVYVAWRENAGAVSTVYFNRSLDDGATWLASPVPLGLGSSSGSIWEVPSLAAVDSAVYVVWARETLSSEGDIYFNRSLDAGTTWLSSIDVSSGLGGAPCAVVYSFAGPAMIPSIYGTLLLQPPWASRARVLGGTPGAPGAGSTSVLEAIPNDLALIGTRVDFQAGVFDPAAMAGIALSNGLELWIL